MLTQYPDAQFMLKDKLFLDFLGLKPKHTEPQLHSALLEHMKQFILELGKDFIFMDSEFPVIVGGKQKRIDLLFYHRALQCLVAVELKAVDFEAEFPNENPSVGIILCPSADKSEVEYTLSRSLSPTMVAEYRRRLIPIEVMQQSLPNIANISKMNFLTTNNHNDNTR